MTYEQRLHVLIIEAIRDLNHIGDRYGEESKFMSTKVLRLDDDFQFN